MYVCHLMRFVLRMDERSHNVSARQQIYDMRGCLLRCIEYLSIVDDATLTLHFVPSLGLSLRLFTRSLFVFCLPPTLASPQKHQTVPFCLTHSLAHIELMYGYKWEVKPHALYALPKVKTLFKLSNIGNKTKQKQQIFKLILRMCWGICGWMWWMRRERRDCFIQQTRCIQHTYICTTRMYVRQITCIKHMNRFSIFLALEIVLFEPAFIWSYSPTVNGDHYNTAQFLYEFMCAFVFASISFFQVYGCINTLPEYPLPPGHLSLLLFPLAAMFLFLFFCY